MLRALLPPTALAAAVLHAVSIFVALGHQHHDHLAGRAAASHRHHHHGDGSCHHHHGPAQSGDQAGESPLGDVPDHDHSHCNLCRLLAQPLWHVMPAAEIAWSPFSSAFKAEVRVVAESAVRIAYHSRGPPSRALCG